jgi:hypothetical protein
MSWERTCFIKYKNTHRYYLLSKQCLKCLTFTGGLKPHDAPTAPIINVILAPFSVRWYSSFNHTFLCVKYTNRVTTDHSISLFSLRIQRRQNKAICPWRIRLRRLGTTLRRQLGNKSCPLICLLIQVFYAVEESLAYKQKTEKTLNSI